MEFQPVSAKMAREGAAPLLGPPWGPHGFVRDTQDSMCEAGATKQPPRGQNVALKQAENSREMMTRNESTPPWLSPFAQAASARRTSGFGSIFPSSRVMPWS